MPQPHTSIVLKGIAKVLEEERLAVPPHQRSFEWTVDEVNELLDDIEGAFNRNGEEYFLGTLVIISATDQTPPQLLDGQQRLATIALLFAAIADKFEALGDNDRKNIVTERYLTKFDMTSGDTLPQLKLNDDDDPFFRSLIRRDVRSPAQGSPDSHKRLYAANSTIQQWILDKLASATGEVDWLIGLCNYLDRSVNVILVQVPDDANAFLIFETLNDRGLDLSVADLLKNYLLGRSGDDLRTVLNLWTRTIHSLTAYGGENMFSTFLRHYWCSKHKVVRENLLYRDIKSRVVSRENVLDFSREIVEESQLYAAILSPEHELRSTASPTAHEKLRTLQLLGLEQYRPLLLAALRYLELDDVESLLTLLIAWNVRLLIVGGLGGGVMERQYSELGQAIRSGHFKNVADIAEKATAFIPNDTVFESSFMLARVAKVKLARYYLQALERQERGEDQPELVPNADPTQLTLEHVLPDRPEDNWPSFQDEDVKAYSKRLGNLVLLTQRMNSQLRSAPFAEKRPVFEASSLALTAEVGSVESWNREAIRTRQERLAKTALDTWPLSIRS